MGNPANVFDIASESLATFLAKAVGGGTWSDVIETTKDDDLNPSTAAAAIEARAGVLWANMVDDFIQAAYPILRSVPTMPGSSTDNAIARFDGTSGATIQNSAVTIDDSGNVATSAMVSAGSVTITEAATVPGGAPSAGTARLWVKDDSPNTLYFTDDAGTDWLVGGAGADDLAGTLGVGNTTGGTNIEVTNGDAIVGEDGGSIAFAAATGIIQLSSCEGTDLTLSTSLTSPVATGGDFGTGTGAGTGATVRGGDGGTTGGAGGQLDVRGGDAQSGDTVGGKLVLRSGNSKGTANAPNVELTSGSVVTGALGVVRITNTCLEIAESSTVPGPTIGAGNGRYWVRNDTSASRPVFTDDTNTSLALLLNAPQNGALAQQQTLANGVGSTVITFLGTGWPTASGQITASDFVDYTTANVGTPPSINGYSFSTIAGEAATLSIQSFGVDLDSTGTTIGDRWALLLQTSTNGLIVLALIEIT